MVASSELVRRSATAPPEFGSPTTPAREKPKRTREPKYYRFTQQELPASRPVLTPTNVIAIFVTISLVFIPVGVVWVIASAKVVETSQRYDKLCMSGMSRAMAEHTMASHLYDGVPCTIPLYIPKTMHAPVYLYYEIKNFYQNHRRFVKSRDAAQLRGESVVGSEDCGSQRFQGSDTSRPIVPCGLSAWSMFNDTYSLMIPSPVVDLHAMPILNCTSGGGQAYCDVPVRVNGIAWDLDQRQNFGQVVPQNFNTGDPLFKGYRGGSTVHSTLKHDEHFIVWMRTATLSHFRKLWGIIDMDLPGGTTVLVNINNAYNTYQFNGEKAVVLSTAEWIGGKNYFVGYTYVGVGITSLLMGLIYLILHVKYPRQLGDMEALSWRKLGLNADSAVHKS